MDFDAHFELVTKHPPLDFQRVVAERVLARRSVIWRAPAGAGKTWATIMPFLHDLPNQAPIADRLIYTLPLGSLASALHQQKSATACHLGPSHFPPQRRTPHQPRTTVSGSCRFIDHRDQNPANTPKPPWRPAPISKGPATGCSNVIRRWTAVNPSR